MPSIVQLLCDLSEAPDTPFIADTIEPGHRDELSALQRLGAVRVGPRPDTITCRACDSDHFAAVEFDERTQHYFHSCPDAGIVWVNGNDLTTLRFDAEWLVDWLTSILKIPTARSRRELINRRVWHLGDAICGGTLMTVIFARRVISQSELDGLASVLRPIHRAEKGVVITTSPRVARQLRLPGGYEFLDLSEIVRSEGDQLTLDAGTARLLDQRHGTDDCKGGTGQGGKAIVRSTGRKYLQPPSQSRRDFQERFGRSEGHFGRMAAARVEPQAAEHFNGAPACVEAN